MGTALRFVAAAALLFASSAALARTARAQPLPAMSATLAAPGVAPACLPPHTDATLVPAAPGSTGVLLRGHGFQPAEPITFGLISVTPAPPDTKVVYHDVQPIVEANADGSGSFTCEAYLDLRFIRTPSYYQIGAFAQSTLALEGTELLPAAVLFVPAMPPTGSGGPAASPRPRTVACTSLSAAVLAFAVAGFWLAAGEERREGSGYGG